jgi:hypothetical protein
MESSKDQSKAGNTSKGELKDKIKPKTDDSDQSKQPPQSRKETGQKGAGDLTTETPSETPAPTPPAESAPPLPFEKDDFLAGKSPKKPVAQPPVIVPSGAIPAVASAKDLDRQMSDKKAEDWLTRRGESYRVHGNERPDSASIQRVSNNKGVCTEILSAVQTKEYAESRARAHLGDIYVDAVVHHCFENYRCLLILEMVNKNPEILDCWDGELPVIKTGATIKDASGKTKNAQYTIMHSYFSFIQFALRDATTKAEAAAQAKILNKEFREKEDVESEQFEIDLIKS